jgi:hypothetical protein
MENKVQIGLITLSMILLNTNIFSQTDGWKTEKTKDGKITVRSRISERTNEMGDEVQLIEYVATTIASVDIQNCISVLKNVSKHKEFTFDDVSKKVKTISDNEWIVYYYTDESWPMSGNDCVAKMIYSEDETNKTTTFTLTAAPSMFEKKDVERMTYYNVKYAFEDLENDKIKMIIDGEMSPVVQAPKWMLRAWFPEGPADALRGIITLANK